MDGLVREDVRVLCRATLVAGLSVGCDESVGDLRFLEVLLLASSLSISLDLEVSSTLKLSSVVTLPFDSGSGSDSVIDFSVFVGLGTAAFFEAAFAARAFLGGMSAIFTKMLELFGTEPIQ